MRNHQEQNECIAVIGSVTQAMHAQNVLATSAIRVEVVKADSSITGRGCAYALMYPCVMEESIQSVLKSAGIRVKNARRRG